MYVLKKLAANSYYVAKFIQCVHITMEFFCTKHVLQSQRFRLKTALFATLLDPKTPFKLLHS